ncbi:cation/H(+) antiporter 27 [Manihot esculenta]|uniref:cation/H(+) antiporter 27 n=1 Tax=Manihot esculenta TaxID=3983 RepID=UPI001CC76C30|nr:cation/H(+) antiporter 27 [Manihot esculenta]
MDRNNHTWMPAWENLTFICEGKQLNNTLQFRVGESPANWPFQLMILQIGLVNSFRLILECVLRPFGKHTFVPQILGAIALGPSLLGQNDTFYTQVLYSPKGVLMINMFKAMGYMFLLFLLSVRLELSIMKECGKLAVILGVASLVVPMVITITFSLFLRDFFQFSGELYKTLPSVAALVSTTSFHVILEVLTDLKLLNSELGRLALSSSMISGISSWLFLAVVFDVQEQLLMGMPEGIVLGQLSKIMVVFIVMFIFRPIMIWMVRKTPDGKPLKEPFVCGIVLMLLCVAMFGEYSGQHFYFAPVILGMATPNGPTVVSSLMENLDCFVQAVFVPCFVIDAGRRTNINLMKLKNFVVVELLMTVSTLAKFVSIIVPSLYFKMPFLDALSLGFILNCKGLFDVQFFSRGNKLRLISNDNFAALVIGSAFQSAMCTWLVKLIYDPSRRYFAYARHTIEHINQEDSELRVLACVYQQDNVPSIISVIEDSNPTKEDPIEVYVLNLKQSVGGTVPLLISHQVKSSSSSYKPNEVDHVINAFCQIERRNQGLSMVQCYTSCAPYPTLHDAVCSMAQEKTTSLIILPVTNSNDPSTRIVNRNILKYAPCSVGILFDPRKTGRSILPHQAMKKVCVIFLGGSDDRETLAYGARMAMNPYIVLALIRLVDENQISDADLIEKRHDLNMITEFKHFTANSSNKVQFIEYATTEGSETAMLLRSICKRFDLILVGRRHDNSSALLSGLSEWNEKEELGVIGDMLASSDFDCRAHVLVIQQQASVVQEMIESPRRSSCRMSISDRPSLSISSIY